MWLSTTGALEYETGSHVGARTHVAWLTNDLVTVGHVASESTGRLEVEPLNGAESVFFSVRRRGSC